MKGTPRKPIQIGRLDPDHAWGSIIAQGTSSSGSRLSYVNATGGSLSSAFNIQYSGMLSFYGSWDVRIEHSSFGDNVDSDDTLHIVYGSYDLEDIRFADCFGDCIDLDLADGTMRGIRVLAAGNDGIDLMTSNSRFRDVVVEGSADKGISVGEASTLTIESLRVSGAQIGAAVKDTSRVYLSEASFADNQTSLSVYADDPVYGGSGELHLRAAKFGVGGVDVQVDDRARLYVYDQPPPPRVLGEGTIERRSGDWPQ